MKHAFVFPGQGSQFPGMGKDHYDNSAFAKKLFEQANELLGFRISDIMFNGTEADLRQTNVTQPAVFLHSIIAYKSIDPSAGSGLKPDMVAGHSLGEFSALVANGTLSFEDALLWFRYAPKPCKKPVTLPLPRWRPSWHWRMKK
jgi:(acyl-carrier-protein) S-malonyltransferase